MRNIFGNFSWQYKKPLLCIEQEIDSHYSIMNDSIPIKSTLLTRRRVLGWSVGGVLAGIAGYLGWPKPTTSTDTLTADALAQSAGAESASTSGPITAEPSAEILIGRNAFVALLKSEFQIELADHSLATVCRLIQVGDEISMISPSGRYTSYSLLFTAPIDFAAESRVYRMTHPQMESMDLFLSPVGKSEKFVHLEAVFSQKV